MKILVFSDSHGETREMARVIGTTTDAAGVIFLGDNVRDIEKVAALHPHLPYYFVAGNCDFMSKAPNEACVELGGVKIYICHGHRHGVKSGLGHLAEFARQIGAQAAFYGHSHIAAQGEKNGITLLNPGSITEPRGDIGASYALVEIEGGRISTRIILV